MPIFQFPRYEFGKNFSGWVIYNQTYKGHLWKDKKTIEHVFNLGQENLIELIDEAQGIINGQDVAAIDVPEILSLFKPIKAQEHKLAFMMQYARSFNSFKFACNLPFVYQLNTFFLTNAERKAIENTPFYDPSTAIHFATHHLISDKFGIGDMQISLEKLLKEGKSYSIFGGVDITLPTAFAFKKGLVGTYFDKRKQRPSLDIHEDLLSPYFDSSNGQPERKGVFLANAESFLLKAVDRMTTIFIENELGSDGHLGVGTFIRSTINLLPHVRLTTKTKFDVPLPRNEWRFIRKPITTQEIQNILNLPHLTVPESSVKISLLNDKILQNLFPQSYKTQVFPGIIAQTTLKISHQGNLWCDCDEEGIWEQFIGVDTWYQAKEKFIKIDVPASEQTLLDIASAQRGYALQSTFFLGVEKNRKDSNWNLGFVASYGALSYGIGSDITLAFTLSREF